MLNKAYLVLETGKTFEGYSFGAEREVIGEVVFTTCMTGYLETLTDKSYYGQIIMHTYPLIGNYGVIPEDFESNAVSALGYIAKDVCTDPSNFRSKGDLGTFLKERDIPGLCGIDTRELTKTLREQGTMNGIITRDPKKADLDKIRAYSVKNAVESVSVKERKTVNNGGKYTVVLLDFGYKESIVKELAKRNCRVVIMPHDASVQDILEQNPDGIMLSNGPGDPADNPGIINNLKQLIAFRVPIFGICLGHQLLALARGFETRKLKYGHRGSNHPVKDLDTGQLYITSQNHGYYFVNESIDSSIARMSFINLNDRTCEGIKYLDSPAFSVQFHPEGSGGPKDTVHLFDEFLKEAGAYAAGREN
ncbi:MAG TPA: carbamoyl phosphate synthase small subunit [Clostridiales bacterium]|nr:carbamoyl phosphate synthase small subunit [Clostridiales bacterium]